MATYLVIFHSNRFPELLPWTACIPRSRCSRGCWNYPYAWPTRLLLNHEIHFCVLDNMMLYIYILRERESVYIYLHFWIYTHMYMYNHMYIYTNMYILVCIYIYIYLFIIHACCIHVLGFPASCFHKPISRWIGNPFPQKTRRRTHIWLVETD